MSYQSRRCKFGDGIPFGAPTERREACHGNVGASARCVRQASARSIGSSHHQARAVPQRWGRRILSALLLQGRRRAGEWSRVLFLCVSVSVLKLVRVFHLGSLVQITKARSVRLSGLTLTACVYLLPDHNCTTLWARLRPNLKDIVLPVCMFDSSCTRRTWNRS